jgi:hypothetical protein
LPEGEFRPRNILRTMILTLFKVARDRWISLSQWPSSSGMSRCPTAIMPRQCRFE